MSIAYSGQDRAVRLGRAYLDMETDPLLKAYAGLTKHQLAWLRSTCREKVLEGGNQSGKSWVSCVNFLLQALGLHPTIVTKGAWRGWYSTTTFGLFSEQIWGHWKALLLWPGESMLSPPTRRVVKVGWFRTNPEMPNFLALTRWDGSVAEIRIKSYDQGRQEFQSASVDLLGIDEEAPDDVYDEVQPRVAARGGQISVVATPVEGVAWLTDLRVLAQESPHIYHGRLDTRDNPGLPEKALQALVSKYASNPDLARLRLEGHPIALEGVVYGDTIFLATYDGKPWHVVPAFRLAPADWEFFRIIDPGYRHCACLWIARNKEGEEVIYRDYMGEDRTIYANAKAIGQLSKRDPPYVRALIDASVMGRDQTTGERMYDVWRMGFAKCWGALRGYHCGDKDLLDRWLAENEDLVPTSRKDVLAGVEICKARLQETIGDPPRPRFRVFDRCKHFLRERRLYRWPPKPKDPHAAAPKEEPVKRHDHTLDCWRYYVLDQPEWIDLEPKQQYPPGSRGHKFQRARRRGVKRW